MMKRICCIALILLPFGLLAQKGITGIGFIDLRTHGTTYEYPEKNDLDLYTLPTGNVIACLALEIHERYFKRKIVDNENNWERIDTRDTGRISIGWGKYYGNSLQYYEEKNGFVRVKINGGNYCINLDELAEVGGTLVLWNTYFANIDLNQMHVLYTMNLRAAPTASSDKTMVVRKIEERQGFHLVEMAGNFEGNWAEVKIHIWKSHGVYCGRQKGNFHTVKGWIKYLDDQGFPNMFPIDVRCG